MDQGMDHKAWRRIEAIVDRAMTLEPEQRNAFLNDACEGDPELLERVTSLLESIDSSEGFMDNVLNDRRELFSDLSTAESHRPHSRTGTHIGTYHVGEQLGRGGMGTVYRAERSDGEFNHRVALKIISRGMDTDENLRRFQTEREILATLNHPNIARLYDGGITADELPYIVMEYVEGTPIDRYCEEQGLSPSERLALFMKVCDAVQYAHNNLIVHRDLKAANILVTDAGLVKVLDFGIAKLLDEELIEHTLPITRAGKRLLTPHYAAPEQFREQPVSTATDVYTLGVLLHRLMTGRFPFQPENRRFYELEQLILHHEADTPSRFVEHAEKPVFFRYLRGDLDSIILKALRKESQNRYSTVENLVNDLQRFRHNKPVQACRGTTLYRASKFLRRHAVALFTLGLFISMAAVFSYIYTTRITQERNQARQEARKTRQMNQFLVNLFNAAKPSEAQGDTLTVYEVLRQGVEKIDQLSEQPEIQAEMLTVIGNVYLKSGQYDLARPILERSLRLQKQHRLHPSRNYGNTLDFLGQLAMDKGNYAKADTLLTKAEKSLRSMNPIPGEELGSVLTDRAMNYTGNGRWKLAEKTQKKALAIYREFLGEQSEEVAIGTNSLAIMQKNNGHLQAALTSYQKALDLEKRLLGSMHPRTVTTTNNLANLLNQLGHSREAESLMREALAKRRKLYGKYHNFIASSLNGLAVILQDRGRAGEVDTLYEEALDILRHLHGKKHPYVGFTLGNWGGAQVAAGKLDQAQHNFEQAQAILFETLGPDHPKYNIERGYLASVKLYRHRYREADTLYRAVVKGFRAQLDENHPRLGNALVKHGLVLLQLGKTEEAARKIREGYSILDAKLEPETLELSTARVAYGWCRLLETPHDTQALELMKSGYLTTVQKLGTAHPLSMDLYKKLREAYRNAGQSGFASTLQDSLLNLSL